MKFIHISDTHLIGDKQPSLYGIDPYFRLEKALDSVYKWHSDARFVAITGDLCDNASDFAYAKLQSIVKNYNLDIYPILGNHDRRDMFESYFSEFKHDGFVQYVKNIDDKVFIFLDTLAEGSPYGEFCNNRLKWLENQLKRHDKKYIYLFMHHHPISCGLYEMDNHANFRTSKEFWSLLSRFKNVKHISFGHIHRIMHSVKDGISLHSTRGTAFQVAYRPDSEKEYLTNEENPTYAIIETDKTGDTRVHHHEYMNEDRLYAGLC